MVFAKCRGIRTDLRVINANLLASNWGAFELAEQHYQSKPFKLSISPWKYQNGIRSAVSIESGNPLPLDEVLKFAANDTNTFELSSGKQRASLPTNKIILPFADTLTIHNSYLYRSDLILLDIIANNPNRPVYFSSRSIEQNTPFLSDFLVNEGLVYHLKTKKENTSALPLYNSINQWVLNGFNNAHTYIDGDAKKTARHYISIMAYTVDALLKEGETQKAGELAKLCAENFPVSTTSFSTYTNALSVLKGLFAAGFTNEAEKYSQQLTARLMQETTYYHSIKNTVADYSAHVEIADTLEALQQLKNMLTQLGQKQKAMEIEKFLAFFAENKK